MSIANTSPIEWFQTVYWATAKHLFVCCNITFAVWSVSQGWWWWWWRRCTLDKEIPGLVTVGDEVNLVWNAKRRLGPMTVGSTEHEEQLLSMVSLKKLLKESNARCLDEESMRRLFLHHFLLRDSPRDLVVSSGETFKRFEIGMHSSLGSSNVRA